MSQKECNIPSVPSEISCSISVCYTTQVSSFFFFVNCSGDIERINHSNKYWNIIIHAVHYIDKWYKQYIRIRRYTWRIHSMKCILFWQLFKRALTFPVLESPICVIILSTWKTIWTQIISHDFQRIWHACSNFYVRKRSMSDLGKSLRIRRQVSLGKVLHTQCTFSRNRRFSQTHLRQYIKFSALVFKIPVNIRTSVARQVLLFFFFDTFYWIS